MVDMPGNQTKPIKDAKMKSPIILNHTKKEGINFQFLLYIH